MDHDVAARERAEILVGETEAIGADVARYRDDAAGDHRFERLGGVFELGAQTVERIVLEDLAAHPLGHVVTLARPNQQHELALRNRSQQPFDQRSTDETGATRDGDALVGKVLADHSAPV